MQIHGAEGVLIQKVVSGVEVILGAVKEEGFGHLVMFGLGGIHTEVLRDVRFALAPLGHDEALNMVRGIRAFPLLEGVRGESGMSLDVLVDYLIRLSLLVEDFPEISEIDLNPVKGTGDDLFVVDARILREGSA
jgi:acetyltransferase